jgi:hypothetical protein
MNSNWRKILSWADAELKVGDTARLIATSDRLDDNGMDESVTHEATFIVDSVVKTGEYEYTKAGRIGTVGTHTIEYGTYFIFPYDNWKDYLEIIYE